LNERFRFQCEITGIQFEDTVLIVNIIQMTTAGWMKKQVEHETAPDKSIKEKNHQR